MIAASRYLSREIVPLGIGALAAGLLLSVTAPSAWLVLLTDGLFVIVVLLAAAGWGAWPTRRLVARERPALQRVLISLALGSGVLSTLVLALGMAGALGAASAWGLVIAGCVLALAARGPAAHAASPRAPDLKNEVSAARSLDGASLIAASLVAVLLAVPLCIAVFTACLPPGIVWPGEANGYDVLEYHLQVQREYFDAGRIVHLPHNVYASFPQQSEMLYLLLMHLCGGPLAAAIPSQLLHMAFGVLSVAVIAAWLPAGRARWVAALAAAATPWVAYLCALAYVENPLLFYSAISAGLIMNQFESIKRGGQSLRAWIVAGLCAGLAGGCKYTALALAPAAMGAAWLIAGSGTLAQRGRCVLAFGIAALLAFSPWVVRNIAFTGNPVFPFATGLLGGAGWSSEQAAQWAAGHRVNSEKGSLPGRVTVAAGELLPRLNHVAGEEPSGKFGVLVPLALLAFAMAWKNRAARWLACWSLLMLLIWATATHMPGRFMVPMIVPLALLIGCAAGSRVSSDAIGIPIDESPRSRSITDSPVAKFFALFAAAMLTLTALNFARQAWQFRAAWEQRFQTSLAAVVGQTQFIAESNTLNRVLPADARVWLVGEATPFYLRFQAHYTTVFNRDPWLSVAAGAEPAQAVAWLRERGITHVVFNWSEIERLRRTYGFAAHVTPEWAKKLMPHDLAPAAIPADLADLAKNYWILSVTPAGARD